MTLLDHADSRGAAVSSLNRHRDGRFHMGRLDAEVRDALARHGETVASEELFQLAFGTGARDLDAAAGAVRLVTHPPLPDPRPAARLPPHPALWPARQFDAQGCHHARSQAAGRRHADRGTRTRRAVRPSPAMFMLRRPHDHHRNLPRWCQPRAPPAPAFPTRRRAMIRHGSPVTTVTPMVFWLMTQRAPIPELSQAQSTPTSETNVARNLIPHQTTLIRPTEASPDRQRLSDRTISKLICP